MVLVLMLVFMLVMLLGLLLLGRVMCLGGLVQYFWTGFNVADSGSLLT